MNEDKIRAAAREAASHFTVDINDLDLHTVLIESVLHKHLAPEQSLRVCVKCGHLKLNPWRGYCKHEVNVHLNRREPTQYCGCKCEFPASVPEPYPTTTGYPPPHVPAYSRPAHLGLPHDRLPLDPNSLHDACHNVWVCNRCGKCLVHCKHKNASNFYEGLKRPCSGPCECGDCKPTASVPEWGEGDPIRAAATGHMSTPWPLAASVPDAGVEAMRQACIKMARDKAEEFRQTAKRWAKHAEVETNAEARKIDIQSRDECFAKHSALLVFAMDLESLTPGGEGAQN